MGEDLKIPGAMRRKNSEHVRCYRECRLHCIPPEDKEVGRDAVDRREPQERGKGGRTREILLRYDPVTVMEACE